MNDLHGSQIEVMQKRQSRGLLLSCTDTDWATIVDFITNGTEAWILFRAVSAGELRFIDTPPEAVTKPRRKRRY